MPEYHGWRDADDGILFVADGPKTPVLVHVDQTGAEERVLATFVSVEAGVAFQDWIDGALAQQAHANKKMSDQLRVLYTVSPPNG